MKSKLRLFPASSYEESNPAPSESGVPTHRHFQRALRRTPRDKFDKKHFRMPTYIILLSHIIFFLRQRQFIDRLSTINECLPIPFVDKMDICVIFFRISEKKSTKSTELSTSTLLSFYHTLRVSSTKAYKKNHSPALYVLFCGLLRLNLVNTDPQTSQINAYLLQSMTHTLWKTFYTH